MGRELGKENNLGHDFIIIEVDNEYRKLIIIPIYFCVLKFFYNNFKCMYTKYKFYPKNREYT